METHGGYGKIFDRCYFDIETGVVFEKNSRKADMLGKQRKTWAVYQADCIEALRGGAGSHLEINFLDIDPYENPWEVLDAFLESDRPKAETLIVVVNDGLRQKVRIGAWDVGSLQGVVSKYGNDLESVYLEVCQELMAEKAVKAGYDLDRFYGLYCGYNKQMTHYYAKLKQ